MRRLLAYCYYIVFSNHSSMRYELERFSFLIVSTQTHRIHHSRLPEHFDKNFAAWFPIWDIIFGTYYAPKKGEFPPTGVAGERDVATFWQAHSFTQREWWKMLMAQLQKARASVTEH